jgi:hypothetical protein
MGCNIQLDCCERRNPLHLYYGVKDFFVLLLRVNELLTKIFLARSQGRKATY